MVYRYLAGYPKGTRIRGEKKFLREAGDGRLVFHWAEKGGRMYWCDCARSYRIGDKVGHPMGPFRNKTFKHHRGSKFSIKRWQYKPYSDRETYL